MPTTTIKKQGTIDYVEVLPNNYNPLSKYGLVVFFHGIDGRISPEYLRDKEIPLELQRWSEFNLIILCPQTKTYFGREHHEAMMNVAATLPLNAIRLITGLSFGGGGLLSVLSIPGIAAQYHAALVVCGVEGVPVGNCEIAKAKLPVLMFYADNDPIVNLANHGLKNYNRLLECNPEVKPILITLALAYHWIWGGVYNHMTLYEIEGKQTSVLGWMLSKTIQAAPAPVPSFSIKMPAEFTTKTPGIKITAETVGEDWDTNGAAWEVLKVPAGVNPWHVITAGGGWIEMQAILTKPGTYGFRLYLRSKTGKKAYKDIFVKYEPDGTPPPPKPVFTEFDHNGQHFIIYEDKTREIK